MKNCNDIKEMISMYIDKEMTEDEIRDFELHIESCSNCKLDLEETINAVELCKNIEDIELPADFKSELRKKLEQAKEEMQSQSKILVFRSKYFKVFSSVAAIFVLIFLMQVLYNSSIKVNVNPVNTIERMVAQDSNISTMSAVATVENRKATINLTAGQSDPRVFEISTEAEKLGGKEEISASSKLMSSMPNTLEFVIPNDKYDEFLTWLSSKFKQPNIKANNVAAEDMTNLLNQYMAEADKLNLKILDLEQTNSTGSYEIDKLKQEKIALDEKIKAINNNRDLTKVTIVFKYK